MSEKEIIKAEIEKVRLIIQSNKEQGVFTAGYIIGQESVLDHFENFVNSMHEKPASDGLEKEIIKAEIERRILDWRMGMSAEAKYRLEAYTEMLEVVNTLPKEPVREELETSIMEYMNHVPENEPELSTTLYTYEQMQAIARHFANWQKRQMMSEEDDKMINSIAVHLNATTGGFPEDRAWADKFMIWLKSLRPQNQWKPMANVIIEMFGARLKLVTDDGVSCDGCKKCFFSKNEMCSTIFNGRRPCSKEDGSMLNHFEKVE